MWYDIEESFAMHALRFLSTGCAVDLVGMRLCFCVFVWAVPEERLKLCFV